MKLTQARLKKLLRYDPETGEFFRRVQNGPRAVTGKRAGGMHWSGYWHIRIDGIKYAGHRLAWLYVYGYLPKELDHKNGDKSSCRIVDLRDGTHAQNMANMKVAKDNRSGFKGVNQQGGRWVARVTKNYKQIYLGSYAAPEEAHAAYCAAAKKLHGEFFNPGT